MHTAGAAHLLRLHKRSRAAGRFVCVKIVAHHQSSCCASVEQWRASDDYDGALAALNALQSNAAALRNTALLDTTKADATAAANSVHKTRHCLQLLGVGQRQLQQLAVVHVAGTKGKGSVCAMTESLLRAHGLRTGFFSSPHLVSPCERLRIDGRPLSKDRFASYLWQVYHALRGACCDSQNGADPPALVRPSAHPAQLTSMPMYFMFMTVMGYYVFVRERVDVAVVEVGVGGRYDCTNVVERPAVCGVTCLDYDHTAVLGSTLDQIAGQKAGIMKPGVATFVAHQPQSAQTLPVLARCAAEAGASVFRVPPLTSPVRLALPGEWQQQNAALALQLWRHWWRNCRAGDASRPPPADALPRVDWVPEAEWGPAVTERECAALQSCVWPGRCQTVSRGRVTYYLDGAHTPLSVRLALDWYTHTVAAAAERGAGQWQQRQDNSSHVLVVFLTGERDAERLLRPLTDRCQLWSRVIFCAPAPTATGSDRHQWHGRGSPECERLRRQWLAMTASLAPPGASHSHHHVSTAACVRDAIDYIEKDIVGSGGGEPVRVFVVGSLHLVGAFLALIDPQLAPPHLYVKFTDWPTGGAAVSSSDRPAAALTYSDNM